MEKQEIFVGIDVSKAVFDVAVYPASGAWQMPYDKQGVAELVKRLAELSPTLIVMEATGRSRTSFGASACWGGVTACRRQPSASPGLRQSSGASC